MKTILVTGTKGFSGSSFVSEAKYRYHNARIIAHARTGISSITGDLTCPSTASKILHACKPDVIVHFAGRVPSARQKIPPEVFDKDNTETTKNLVMAASSLSKLPLIILPSTAGVYPVGGISKDFRTAARQVVYAQPSDALPINIIQSAYAKSKLASEKILQKYTGPWVILRKPTVIGPKDHRGNFLQLLAYYILEQKKVPSTSLQRCADYISTTDVFNAINLCLAKTKAHRQVFNIGSGLATTGYTALNTMAKIAAKNNLIPSYAYSPPPSTTTDYPGTILDITKSKRDLGYEPHTSLDKMCTTIWRDVISHASPHQHLKKIFPDFK